MSRQLTLEDFDFYLTFVYLRPRRCGTTTGTGMRAGVGRGSASVRANCPKRARNFFAFLNITLSCKFTNEHAGCRWQLENLLGHR